MKLPPLRFIAALLLLVGGLSADSRESAFQARALLGPEVWSRVWRIENESPGPHSRYPRSFHGLVIAFQGALWLYTEFDGTQTLSLRAERLAEDQADPAPLLRAIDPGLTRFEDVTDAMPFGIIARPPPRHCFLSSVARWLQLRHDATPPSRCRLLAYYVKDNPNGHMVLEYWRGDRRYIFDPDHPAYDREIPARLGHDPLKVARALVGRGERNRPVRAQQLNLGGA